MEIKTYKPEELLGQLNDVEKKNAPPYLYLAGDVALFHAGTWVSVVGSRKLSTQGEEMTKSLVRPLIEQGFIVVSGLAEGTDTIAHKTALESGGRTVAVLGTPLDSIYPAKNRPLQERIIQEHLALSQFPLGSSIQKKNFPMRNRTMALVSAATIIVEAGEQSGTVHQGWEALRLGRLLYIMEPTATNPSLSWPQEMFPYGARTLSAAALPELFEALPRRHYGLKVAF